MVEVILYFSIASSTAPGSNAGSTTSEPPRISVARRNAMPACDSGVHARNRISSGNCHSAIWICGSVTPERNVLTTPFGLPVVPPV